MPMTRKPVSQPPAADQWMGAREAADALGISRLALYERALAGEIASQKVAGRRVFDRADVMKAARKVAA